VKSENLSRRDFSKLSAAAFGGMVAGTAISTSDVFAEDAKEKEVHVCRGLNGCKGKGACKTADNGCKGKNACAGKGGCASAKAHKCAGSNDCKGQGGCGPKAGENACKGKGKCAVPLKDKAWKGARARFEARMKKAGKKFGDAPAKPKKEG
jgi:hypothetical protein